MLIENTEAFKEWLTKQLEPICDADPMALAKYVVALVKKDKPESELADNCNDQLEVFLQDKTADFTKSLFTALNTRSYLPGAEVKKEPQEEKPDKQEPEILKEVKQEPKEQENKDEHRERRRKTPEREDRGDRRRSPLRERRSPPHSPSLRDRRSPPHRRSVQERLGGRRGDDRRGGRRPDDRSARRPGPYWQDRDRRRFDRDDGPPRDRRDLRRRSLSPRRRTPPPRDGEQGQRSPTKDANANKSPRADCEKDVEGMEQGDGNKDASSASKQDKPRARSPSDHLSSRDRSDREMRSMSRRRSRSPGRSRPRSASSRRSRSRSWTPRSRSRSRSRSFPRRRSRSRSRDRDRDRYNPIPSRRQRCRDFEEKGYCMQGDFCPYDHGLDPVVVEDINLPVPLPYNPGAPPPGLPPPGAPHLGPPPGMPMAGPPPVPSMPPRGPPPHMPPHDMRFPPPPLGQPMMGPPAETPYNPEAPSLAVPPPGAQPPFWRPPGPGAPTGVPPGVPPPESGAPPAPYSQAPLVAPRRDLVTVQTVQPAAPPMGDQRHVIQTNRPPPFINNGGHQQQHHQHYGRGRGRGGYNRSMGPRPDITNTTLEVRKIPQDMNNIAKLNEHFAKFGTLVNVQIAFDGDREAALVSFASNKEASSAYRSSDPVFNNRFIKVFWHNKEAAAAAGTAGSASTTAPTSAAPSTSSAPVSKEIPPPEKLSLNNAQKRQEEKEKVVVNALKSGLITKTLYNTQVIKNKMAAINANKAADPQRKKEDALKKKVEIQRQKQELLKKLLEEQKGLLDRMDKNKTTMSADEKKTILSTIKSLANHIEKLRKEINSYQANQPKQPVVVKTKQEAQKQILDTELELMAKEGAPGIETVQLKKRLADLRREASHLGLSHGRGRGRGRGFSSRGRGAVRGRTSLCVDRRPRCLLVSGHEDHEKEDLTKHFAYFGELESVEFTGDGDMLVTYKTRSDAEQAYRSASRYKKLTLSMSWYKPPPPAPPGGSDTNQAAKPGPSEEQIKKELAAADNSEDDDDDYANLDEDILLGDMDDDDSLEDGDRSWRR